MISPTPNRLLHEKSPYLLQHAGNPVDWYPWGEEAFDRAKKEDKPIFLSIGYSTCHWCHVMAHESFEDRDRGRAPQRGLRLRQGRPRGAAGHRRDLHERLPDDDGERRLASHHHHDARPAPLFRGHLYPEGEPMGTAGAHRTDPPAQKHLGNTSRRSGECRGADGGPSDATPDGEGGTPP